MTEITRRPATDADADFARRAHHEAYREVVVRQFGAWDEAAQDEFFRGGWNPAAFDVILCDGEPCGYTRVEDRADGVHVRELVILPRFQNRGVGSRLLREVIERAKARGVPVRLGTHHANRAAELYRRLGFRECGAPRRTSCLNGLTRRADAPSGRRHV